MSAETVLELLVLQSPATAAAYVASGDPTALKMDLQGIYASIAQTNPTQLRAIFDNVNAIKAAQMEIEKKVTSGLTTAQKDAAAARAELTKVILERDRTQELLLQTTTELTKARGSAQSQAQIDAVVQASQRRARDALEAVTKVADDPTIDLDALLTTRVLAAIAAAKAANIDRTKDSRVLISHPAHKWTLAAALKLYTPGEPFALVGNLQSIPLTALAFWSSVTDKAQLDLPVFAAPVRYNNGGPTAKVTFSDVVMESIPTVKAYLVSIGFEVKSHGAPQASLVARVSADRLVPWDPLSSADGEEQLLMRTLFSPILYPLGDVTKDSTEVLANQLGIPDPVSDKQIANLRILMESALNTAKSAAAVLMVRGAVDAAPHAAYVSAVRSAKVGLPVDSGAAAVGSRPNLFLEQ